MSREWLWYCLHNLHCLLPVPSEMMMIIIILSYNNYIISYYYNIITTKSVFCARCIAQYFISLSLTMCKVGTIIPTFTDEETEAKRYLVTFLRSHAYPTGLTATWAQRFYPISFLQPSLGLTQWLVHNGCSVNVGWMNDCIKSMFSKYWRL